MPPGATKSRLKMSVVRPGLRRKSMSRGRFLVEFEVPWSTLELPDHLFDDTSKQGRKVIKNNVKMEAAKHL